MHPEIKGTLMIVAGVFIFAAFIALGLWYTTKKNVESKVVNVGEKVSNKVQVYIATRDSMLGETVMLGTDTLLIVDYSLLHNTYRMSNGKDYNGNLIEKLPRIRK